ncbi:MAG: acyltransferase 3 [Mucilaginibacter sp.]|nr:acyltransferase 3 [Mucilaginibacter sp.]
MSDTLTGHTNNNYVPELDGFRAIAIISVMLYHFEKLSVGWLGVQFFFVLSGYLITRGLVIEKKKIKKFGGYIKVFYFKRILRIFPIYFLYVICFLLFCYFTGDILTAKGAFIPLVTYTMNIYALMPHTVNLAAVGYLWSLSAEEQFYLVWPLIVFFVPDFIFKKVLYAIILLIPVCRLIMFYMVLNHGKTTDYAGLFVYINTLSQFDAFAIGALVVCLTDIKVKNTFSLRKGVFFAVVIFLIVGEVNLYLTNKTLSRDITTFGYRIAMVNNYQYVWGYTLINTLAAFAIFVIVYYKNVIPFLKNKVLVYVGKISYGMYIFHMPILVALDGFKNKGVLAGVIRFILYFIITLLVSHFSFKYFESYFINLKKKIQFTD